VEVSGRAG